MKRFYVSLCILALLVFICFYSLNLFSATHLEMSDRLAAIEEAALADEDHALVSGMCFDYAREWKRKERLLLRVVRHPQLDEISSLTAELGYLATDDSYSHLLAAVERIKTNLDKIGNAEVFNA